MTPKSKKLAGALALLGAGAAAIAIGTSSSPIDSKTVQIPSKVWAWPKGEPTTGTCAKTVYLYDPSCKLSAVEDRQGQTDDAGLLIAEASVTGDANEALEKAPAGRFPYASLAECWSKEIDVPPIKLDEDCYKPLPGSYVEYPFVRGAGWPRAVLATAWASPATVNFDCACGPGATRTKTGKALAPGEVAKIADLTLGPKDWWKVPCAEFNLGRETSVLPKECCIGDCTGYACGDSACGRSCGACGSDTTCRSHQCVALPNAGATDAGRRKKPKRRVARRSRPRRRRVLGLIPTATINELHAQLMHGHNAIARGDCTGALEALLVSAGAVGARGAGPGSGGALVRSLAGDFIKACVKK